MKRIDLDGAEVCLLLTAEQADRVEAILAAAAGLVDACRQPAEQPEPVKPAATPAKPARPAKKRAKPVNTADGPPAGAHIKGTKGRYLARKCQDCGEWYWPTGTVQRVCGGECKKRLTAEIKRKGRAARRAKYAADRADAGKTCSGCGERFRPTRMYQRRCDACEAGAETIRAPEGDPTIMTEEQRAEFMAQRRKAIADAVRRAGGIEEGETE